MNQPAPGEFYLVKGLNKALIVRVVAATGRMNGDDIMYKTRIVDILYSRKTQKKRGDEIDVYSSSLTRKLDFVLPLAFLRQAGRFCAAYLRIGRTYAHHSGNNVVRFTLTVRLVKVIWDLSVSLLPLYECRITAVSENAQKLYQPGASILLPWYELTSL